MAIAHLNGGPYDGRTMSVAFESKFTVEQNGRTAFYGIDIRRGSYKPRRDASGTVVPGPEPGTQEWDWQGWQDWRQA